MHLSPVLYTSYHANGSHLVVSQRFARLLVPCRQEQAKEAARGHSAHPVPAVEESVGLGDRWAGNNRR